MIERDKKSNINEEIDWYNPGRVQDGGYMNRVINQIGVVLIESRNVWVCDDLCFFLNKMIYVFNFPNYFDIIYVIIWASLNYFSYLNI